MTQQYIKLSLYTHLRLLLFFSALYSTTWMILLTMEKWLVHIFNWRLKWIQAGGWHFLYLALLVAIGFMFWPNERSSQFAYQFQIVSNSGSTRVRRSKSDSDISDDGREHAEVRACVLFRENTFGLPVISVIFMHTPYPLPSISRTHHTSPPSDGLPQLDRAYAAAAEH